MRQPALWVGNQTLPQPVTLQRCLQCSALCEALTPVCPRCGAARWGPDSRPAEPPQRLPRSLIPFLIVGAFLAVFWLRGEWQWSRLTRQHAAERSALEQEQAAEDAALEEAIRERVAATETEHQKLLADQDFIQGKAGARARNAEWERRLAHDPALATTAFETNLLHMSRLGADPRVSAREALSRVALLSAPTGSRAEVVAAGNQFVVRVAFKMSSLATEEAGAVTKHRSKDALRREVEEVSARVLRNLFDSCGTRGIAKIQVSCNHAVRKSIELAEATASERREIFSRAPTVMDKLYRMSLEADAARTVADWRRISLGELLGKMTVEFDGIRTLELETTGNRNPANEDPNTPLQF